MDDLSGGGGGGLRVIRFICDRNLEKGRLNTNFFTFSANTDVRLSFLQVQILLLESGGGGGGGGSGGEVEAAGEKSHKTCAWLRRTRLVRP